MPKLIGMIHLPPLPGSPGYSGLSIDDYLKYSLGEADKIVRAGFDGVIVENYMDYPYGIYIRDHRALEILGRIIEVLRKRYNDLLIGLNILRNSGIEAADIVCRCGGDFIRVNAYSEPVYSPEGVLYPISRLIWEHIRELGCSIKIYADVNVKHSKPIIPYIEALYNTCTRGRVSGVIVTGIATGYETPVSHVYIAKQICSDHEVFVGSGVSIENIGRYIDIADGFIIGTSIKEDSITTNPVDEVKARKIVEYVKKLVKRIEKQSRHIRLAHPLSSQA